MLTGNLKPVHIYCQCSRSPFYVLMTFKIVAEIYYFLFRRLSKALMSSKLQLNS